jgi:hypothetical protein
MHAEDAASVLFWTDRDIETGITRIHAGREYATPNFYFHRLNLPLSLLENMSGKAPACLAPA